ELGRIVAPRLMAAILGEFAGADIEAESTFVIPAAWEGGQAHLANCRYGEYPQQRQSTYFVSEPSRENIVQAMNRQPAVFGADGTGRYWFAESYPTCDAVLTVVHLLQALSRSD